MADEKEDIEILKEIDSPEADTGVEAPESIEDKYATQMRQILTQKVELPMSSLYEMLDPKKGQIDLSPEFQRREIWDVVRRARFIESIIMNIPLPPIFLGEVDYGQWVVLDGRQRLTSIYEFQRNLFPLSGLKVWKELNGKYYNDLQKEGLEKFLVRQFIPAVTVKKESSDQVKYDVFERLNTGGVVALPMEIRNAVFRGAFNKSLHALSVTADFVALWGIPADAKAKKENPFFNRMYDLEQVLRFFAVPDYKGGLRFKDYLGEFMAARNLAYEKDKELAAADVARFENAHRAARRVLGDSAFLRPLAKGGYSTGRSAPMADAVLSAVSGLKPAEITDGQAAKIKESIETLARGNVDFQNATTRGTNGKGAIETRLRLLKEAVAAALK